ncbi:DUF1275 domain-containing protein [Peptoniphilus sp. MSJ-1]|uniref:DUF1275 domain-containing protein n=1 Tax=Peptoniphilus ovalis TaxID=2841503 RepID=A0ABS6FFJ7_9FIRM|nr:YoaK family protein [Peptoniphilus ovalis]MBU5668808.1 DUF1275 domain-containing protein [Peptoniphilus ovalis]
MKIKTYENLHETFLVVFFMTLAGGFQDAYSYILRGGVFANAQTGNIVLLFKNIIDLNLSGIISYIVPIFSFILGIYVAVIFEHKFKDKNLHWRQFIIMFEIIIMIIVAIIPQSHNNIANALLSFSCAMQVNAFKKIYGLNFASTMCIGNLRSATENLCNYHITGKRENLENAKKYYAVILIFGLGAGLGYIMSSFMGLKAIVVTAVLLLIAFIILFFEKWE